MQSNAHVARSPGRAKYIYGFQFPFYLFFDIFSVRIASIVASTCFVLPCESKPFFVVVIRCVWCSLCCS